MTRLAPYLIVLALLLPSIGMAQNDQEPITIGLLLPDRFHDDVVAAAELAIDQANSSGAYKNRQFKLLIRTTEGFWGAGSKESVNLVYEDQVRAIVGALDGRNGHLAEQVATKSHLTYIEAYATDPTLSQAFVPWFMRVVPNDNQQSVSILKQIQKEGGGKIGILSKETYDTRYAVKSLTKTIAAETGMSPLVLDLDTTSNMQDDLIEKNLGSKIDHLVIPFDAIFLKDLIETLGEENPDLKIYGTLHFSMGLESRKEALDSYEGIFMIAPSMNNEKKSSLPDSRSAYMYDAINLVINAIRHAGLDRDAITDFISKSTFTGGATGNISFDELGNRQGASSLIQIQNGEPQLIDQP